MRIISGSARGVQLKSPKGNSTRPTSDRVKESIFNILRNDLLDSDVLDLFAGTGALGLESLSRGSRSAAFIDNATAKLIQENSIKTKLNDRSRILNMDVIAALDYFQRHYESFDLIFCDPPYSKTLFDKIFPTLNQSSILRIGGKLIVEHGIADKKIPTLEKLTLTREIDYGHTTSIWIFQREE